MNALARTLIASALVAATGVASAGPRHHYGPRHHHHHHHRVSGLGALAVGLAVAVPLIALANHADRTPDVVIYPRNGQSNAQLEADTRECNRWATTQPAAMADASVFNRAVDACMDGRGYTLR